MKFSIQASRNYLSPSPLTTIIVVHLAGISQNITLIFLSKTPLPLARLITFSCASYESP
jgi:hypothetical protein